MGDLEIPADYDILEECIIFGFHLRWGGSLKSYFLYFKCKVLCFTHGVELSITIHVHLVVNHHVGINTQMGVAGNSLYKRQYV